MMCLGWKTRSDCPTRGSVQVTPPTGAAQCPDIMWFWVAAVAIGLGAVAKGSKKEPPAA